jgi:anti-sigma factor RsiW
VNSRDTSACDLVEAQIQAYVDGELDAVECGPIEAHCRSCPACAALVQSLRQTIDICRHAGRAPVPEAVRERARRRMRELLDARRE